jgi:positive regulator of sigma E activity
MIVLLAIVKTTLQQVQTVTDTKATISASLVPAIAATIYLAKSQALKKAPLLFLLMLLGMLAFAITLGLIFSSLLIGILALLIPLLLLAIVLHYSRKITRQR